MAKHNHSTSIEVPIPTHWIEHAPEGSPPEEALLLMLGMKEGEDGAEEPVLYTGYYSEKLNIFLETSGLAVEEEATITHYHIVHDNKGKLILMN